jgi:lysozyme
MQRAAGAPMSIPDAPSSELVSDIERDSDTWDTNYEQQSAGVIRRVDASPKVSGEEDIKTQIKNHEGFRPEPYKDSEGYWTIGYGHLLSKDKTKEPPKEWRGRTITREEGDALFEEDYKRHRDSAARNIPGFDKLNESGKRAMIDLTFNMGPNWMKEKGFKRFEAAMSQSTPDVEKAAQSLEQSLWYKQVKGRGKTVVGDLRAGLDPGRVYPVERVAGTIMDNDYKAIRSSGTETVSTPVVAPVLVTNNTQNNTMARRPMQSASAVTKDPSLIRTSMRDSQHPVFTG